MVLAAWHRHLRDGGARLAGLRDVVNVDDSARAAYIGACIYTQAGAHMLIHDVCSTNRNRASNASEARLHTQSQGRRAEDGRGRGRRREGPVTRKTQRHKEDAVTRKTQRRARHKTRRILGPNPCGKVAEMTGPEGDGHNVLK